MSGRAWWLLPLALVVVAVAARQSGTTATSSGDLTARIRGVVPQRDGPLRRCDVRKPGTVVLLVLGQSNAGNHGGRAKNGPSAANPTVTVFNGSGCASLQDPLPGATGQGQSIWSHLEPAFAQRGRARDVVLAVVAVEGTSMEEWTADASPLKAHLQNRLAAFKQAGLVPDLVLWQQGEADARAGTQAAAYVSRFEALRAQLRDSGVRAPIVMAQSTMCNNGGSADVRQAIAQLSARHADLRVGPDTDTLRGPMRDDGCHFSEAGLQAAARLWAVAIEGALP